LKISEIILNINKKIIMPKSRNRKNHKQKVNQRLQKIREKQRKMQKEYTKMFEQLKNSISANTENLNVNVNGENTAFEVVSESVLPNMD